MLFDAGGAVLAASERARALLGDALERLELVRDDGTALDRAEHPAAVAIAGAAAVADAILGVRRADGALDWLLVAAEPLWRAGRAAPSAAAVSFTDVSERRTVALEHRALSRLSRAVIAGAPRYEVFDLAAAEAARLVGADGGGVARYVEDDHIEVMGSWGAMRAGEHGTMRRLVPGGELFRARATGRPVRVREVGPRARSATTD